MGAKLGAPPELVAQARAASQARIGLEQRFPMEIRYARELHWLEVRDPFTGEWHQVLDQDAPPHWRRRAYAEKAARRRESEQRASVSRQTLDEGEVAF